MALTYDSAESDASFRAAHRFARQWAPDTAPLGDITPSLESMSTTVEAPRLAASEVIEDSRVRARRVDGNPVVAFAAFLDGTQQSRVVLYADGMPVVHGTVASVIRRRENKRMTTWPRGPLVSRRLYIPRAHVPASLWSNAERDGFNPRDTTTPDRNGLVPSRHPFSLLERAVHDVQNDRETVEQTLAERWCASERAPLFIDGGISRSEVVATSTCAIGVVKSHRTLYVGGDDLSAVFGLEAGWRTSVFEMQSSWRTSVVSWYLRLRDAKGHDPMWGLVRIECARPANLSTVGDRADEVSRWVLAEASPLALPDGRWDRMVYGIRDCEEFLRAIS
jgi:hypothetical protein